jgi:CRISPR-associated protein Cmr4
VKPLEQPTQGLMKIHKRSIPYLIHCVTPLHVGSGDSNYGIIDNLVQRDPLTNRPIIHSSSLKGALREYFEIYQASEDDARVKVIFGSAAGETERQQEGLFDFHQGYLLSLPVRSSKYLYANVTTPGILKDFKAQLELYSYQEQSELTALSEQLAEFFNEFGSVTEITGSDPDMKEAILEEYDFTVTQSKGITQFVKSIFGENLVVMPDEHFSTILNALPVIARNKLENGKSINLFYEEVVPRESRFFTIITAADRKEKPAKEEAERKNQAERQRITTDAKQHFDLAMNAKQLIQLGANASVGYGKTLFSDLTKLG